MDGSTKGREAPAAVTPARMPRRSLRNIALLAMCQALTQSSNTLMFASSALAVLTIVSPDMRMWANMPITMQHLGVMLTVFPASMLMMRRGRKFGFRTGSVMGMIGASLAALGLGLGSFPVMCLGGIFLGNAIANMQLYRFAAVELAPGAFRAQAISYVTAGGVIAGIVGPSLARFTPDLWVPLFQASFVAVVVVHVIVFIILGFIEFPEVKPEDTSGPQRPLSEIVTQPAFMVACAGSMIAFGVMSFVMAASPLAIVQCGLSRTEAPITIFVHVMGMFIPSFFTGHLIARFGIGWNFLFVGATTLLTTTYRPSERGKAQAFNDFMVFGVTTVSSLMASVVLELWGWADLNYMALTLVLVALAVIAVFRLRNPARA